MKNTEEKKEKLFEVKEVEGTPFAILQDEKGYCVLFAQYKISEVVESRQEALQLIERKDWNLILNVTEAQLQIREKFNKEQEIINNKNTK